MPLSIETPAEFANRHGGEGIYSEGVLLFADGASMENTAHGARWEPPTDPSVLAQAKLRYWESRLKRAKEGFYHLKEGLMETARARAKDGLPPPGAAELRQLAEVEKAIRKLQKRVAEARAEVEQTPRGRENARKVKRHSESMQRGEQFVTQVNRIKV
jgi:hypothetical protein